MRFILLENPVNVKNDNSINVELLARRGGDLDAKQAEAKKVISELKLKGSPISYIVQDATNASHSIFFLVAYLYQTLSDNLPAAQVFKYLDVRKIAEPYYENIVTVIKGLKTTPSNTVKKLYDFIKSPSLYTRNKQDFNYTYRILETLVTTSKLKKYFKDPSKIDMQELLDNGQVKPAGISPKDNSSNSIFGVIDAWSKGQDAKSKNSKDKSETTKGNGSNSDGSYVSFEEVNKMTKKIPGKRIKINAEFEYDPSYSSDASDHWRPVFFQK